MKVKQKMLKVLLPLKVKKEIKQLQHIKILILQKQKLKHNLKFFLQQTLCLKTKTVIFTSYLITKEKLYF